MLHAAGCAHHWLVELIGMLVYLDLTQWRRMRRTLERARSIRHWVARGRWVAAAVHAGRPTCMGIADDLLRLP